MRQATRSTIDAQPGIDSAEPLLTVREACRLLHVHGNTLRRWGDMGLVKVRRVGPARQRRFRREDIEDLLWGTLDSIP
jgi:excisionase family DNA binding protein